MDPASITMDARAIQVRRGQPRYPERLERLPAEETPESLWIAGPWVPGARAVAVVGARAAHHRGLELGFAVGDVLGRAGVDVISGGALGVDASAHQGALAASGVTVAVLGAGIDVPYPQRHVELFERIRESGALVTQFPP